MFKGSNTQSDLNGVLDAGSHIHGELRFENRFSMRGKLTGSVSAGGILEIGEGGEIDGEVRVRRVSVSGTVRGSIHASEQIEIFSSGRVEADLFTPCLKIEEGAFFEGSCVMKGEDKKPATQGPQKVTAMPMGKR